MRTRGAGTPEQRRAVARRYSDAGIAQALELVAQGKTLREAGATVGASHVRSCDG
jgi:hypothetical protein